MSDKLIVFLPRFVNSFTKKGLEEDVIAKFRREKVSCTDLSVIQRDKVRLVDHVALTKWEIDQQKSRQKSRKKVDKKVAKKKLGKKTRHKTRHKRRHEGSKK